MLNFIQFIIDSITRQKQTSVVGCKLTVQNSDGEQISINIDPVQERLVQKSESEQRQSPLFIRLKCKNSRHTIRTIKPIHAEYSELVFDFFKTFLKSHTCSSQEIKDFFEVKIKYLECDDRQSTSILSNTKPKIDSSILMILILKLYEKISCSEHNPHPYFFVLKPLFQVNRKNLRNKYSERIITLVQYIASIEIDDIESLVNLIFEFGKYVGKTFFFETLHNSIYYRENRSRISNCLNKKISEFIDNFFKKNPEINQRAISEFGERISIW